jgi:aspartyl-tRNA(Asn)/glutamyl-tRNA(Gln) amidotransferase subunit B
MEITAVKIRPEQLVKMLKMIDAGTINGKIAKIVFEEVFMTGKDPEQVVSEKGLVQISDSGELENMARKVLDNNPQSVADYLAGKEQAFKFLVGQMMKETKGRANPALVNELLKKELEKRK